MFKVAENKQIGEFVSRQIEKKFSSTRQFCKAYIEAAGGDANDEELRKMSNRLSQIKQGKKAIQIYDLSFFTYLLDVTCETLLSAGETYTPMGSRITNYSVAISKDKAVWEKHIKREDDLILNTDEYGKTIIDYALEFENYKFIKYLMEKGYIWFVGDKKNYGFSFGAGTSIERKYCGNKESLSSRMAQCDELRQKMIILAIKKNDFDILSELKAREIPSLYEFNYYNTMPTDVKTYYNSSLLCEIGSASKRMLDYFSDEFILEDQKGRAATFIFPYMAELIKILASKKSPHLKSVLNRAIEHNKKIYNMLKKLFEGSVEYYKKENYLYSPDIIEKCIKQWFVFYEDNGFVKYMDIPTKSSVVSNIVKCDISTGDDAIDDLVDELNNSYDDIINIKP